MVAVGVLVVGVVTPAFAAKPAHGGGGSSGGSGGGSTTTGYDVSYPQCGTTLPSSAAFAIVGVNGGLANDLNPCLGPTTSYPSYTQSELYWAAAATSGSSTSKVALYVNTADPGNEVNGQLIADWPQSGGTSSVGTCTTTTVTINNVDQTVGENSVGCAWQYGYNKAAQDAVSLTSAATTINTDASQTVVSSAPANYQWWLDVETGNTWQTNTAMNVADLQGMIAGFGAAGVGVYSTSTQWNSITGGTTSSSGSLVGIPNWIPGARTQKQAASNCSLASFTGGTVQMTQWTGNPDNDMAC